HFESRARARTSTNVTRLCYQAAVEGAAACAVPLIRAHPFGFCDVLETTAPRRSSRSRDNGRSKIQQGQPCMAPRRRESTSAGCRTAEAHRTEYRSADRRRAKETAQEAGGGSATPGAGHRQAFGGDPTRNTATAP